MIKMIMQNQPIYLDYMATTPVDDVVISKMNEYLGIAGCFGNPSSVQHAYGVNAAQAVEQSRMQVAQAIGADSEEIIFTSGATEANNLAIFGAANFYQRKGRHLITLNTEHKSVLDCFKQLERDGFEVTYLSQNADGLLDLQFLERALREDTVLVSIMHVNNEIGVIQDIQSIGNLLKDKGIIFHVDAAQSVGKLPIDLNTLPVHLMSLSAHKNYGPKGVGALFIRQKPRIRLCAQIFGGGQEGGIRPGTLPTHQIVGMGTAFALSESLREVEQARISQLSAKLWDGIKHIHGVVLNGSRTQRVAGNLNVSLSACREDAFLALFHDLAISKASACASASLAPSYVLSALGISEDIAQKTIRLSLGRFTTDEEIHQTINIINRSHA